MIASAFLVAESTMAQRMVRAKRTLRVRQVPFAMPDPDDLGDRLAEVLAVIYLVFNEGWLASSARLPERRDLVHESVALADLLVRLMPREPEVLALRALTAFHQSRADTRFDGWGRLVPLAEQDRTRWDRAQIAMGTALLDRALSARQPGAYQNLPAADGGLHVRRTP